MGYDYIIVGAGLYGAVFAHEMTAQGKKCLVLEKRSHIAGNIYTEEVEGIQVHKYGAHIFHTSDREVWEYVNRFAEFNHYVNSPVARYKDELYNLPFNMNTFHQLWGVKTPVEAKARIEEQKAYLQKQKAEDEGQDAEQQPKEPQNLEEQALSLVGPDIYEKLIKGYTEKQWGRDCKELPAFIIRRLPLRFVYDNNYFNDRYQGIPVDGYTKLVEKLLEGSDVLLNTDFYAYREEHPELFSASLPDFSAIDSAGEGENGCCEAKFPTVVFTGMIDEYYDFCYGPLEYRTLRFEEELLDEENYQGNAVVNYTEREVPYTRIIEHKHFAFGKQEKTVITREYPCEWKPGDAPYYPVNNEKNDALYAKYLELAKKDKVHFGGRLGRYKYYDMDKTIRAALDDVHAELNAEEQ